MRVIPFYLSDTVMPIYKGVLTLAYLLTVSSIFVSLTYAVVVGSFSIALILFAKGIIFSSTLSFVASLAFWKKYQILYQNCKKRPTLNCNEVGFFAIP